MVMNMVKMSDRDKEELMSLIEENEYNQLSDILEGTKLNWLIKALNGERPAMYDDNVYYSCRIEVTDAGASPEEQVKQETVYLNPEMYLSLLIWKMNNRIASFNYLAIDEPVVYETVLNQVGEADITYERYPKGFFIRLTEIEEDVYKILGDPSICRFFNSDDDALIGILCIGDRKVTIHVQKLDGNDVVRSESLEGIDADQMFQLFDADTYEGLAEKLISRYRSEDVMTELKSLLDERTVHYDYEFEM